MSWIPRLGDLLLTHEEFDELYRTVKKNQLSHLADELVFQLVQRNRLHLALEFGLEKAVVSVNTSIQEIKFARVRSD